MCHLWTQGTENQRSSWKSNAKNLNTVKYLTDYSFKIKKKSNRNSLCYFFFIDKQIIVIMYFAKKKLSF